MHFCAHPLRWIEIVVEVVSCCPPSNGLLYSTDDPRILISAEVVPRVSQSVTNYRQDFITDSTVIHANGEGFDNEDKCNQSAQNDFWINRQSTLL